MHLEARVRQGPSTPTVRGRLKLTPIALLLDEFGDRQIGRAIETDSNAHQWGAATTPSSLADPARSAAGTTHPAQASRRDRHLTAIATEPQVSRLALPGIGQYIAKGQFPCSQPRKGKPMPVESYVYVCKRCGERIEAPRPIVDKSLCPQTSPSGARCLGHLERIEPDAAISAGRRNQPERHFKGNNQEQASTQHPCMPSRWKPSLN